MSKFGRSHYSATPRLNINAPFSRNIHYLQPNFLTIISIIPILRILHLQIEKKYAFLVQIPCEWPIYINQAPSLQSKKSEFWYLIDSHQKFNAWVRTVWPYLKNWNQKSPPSSPLPIIEMTFQKNIYLKIIVEVLHRIESYIAYRRYYYSTPPGVQHPCASSKYTAYVTLNIFRSNSAHFSYVVSSHLLFWIKSNSSSRADQFSAIASRAISLTNECSCHFLQHHHQLTPPLLVQYL